MSCGFREQLTALRDGALTESEAKRVEDHLPGCAGCQKALAELDRTLAALRALRPAPVGSPDTVRLLARLARGKSSVPAAFSLKPWWLPAGGLALAASAAVVVTMVGRTGRDRALDGVEAEPEAMAIAANYELLSDYELVGMEQPDDVELVAQLDRLERP